MARQQVIKCIHTFESINEKERSQNYTKIWIKLINQKESNKFNKNAK